MTSRETIWMKEWIKGAMKRPSMVNIGTLLLTVVMSFALGYYVKYKNVKDASHAIIAQAELNKVNDKALLKAMVNRELQLDESLKSIGMTENEIKFLYAGEDTKISQLKSKFTEYLPGKVKWMKSKTVYVPRKDCADDYLGDKDSYEGNMIILEGRDKRLSNQ